MQRVATCSEAEKGRSLGVSALSTVLACDADRALPFRVTHRLRYRFGQLNNSSVRAGSMPHLAIELFKLGTGIQAVHVLVTQLHARGDLSRD